MTTANTRDPIHRGRCNGRCAGMFDFLDVIVSPHDGDFWGSITGTCTRVDNCNTKTGGRASSMVGIAVRQLSGPRLRR